MTKPLVDQEGWHHQPYGEGVCACVCIDNHRDNAPICQHAAVPSEAVTWPICPACAVALRVVADA